MALAFQTDSTRVMSFMFANAGSNRSYRNIGVKQGHHDLSHHGNDEEKKSKIGQINQYHMSLFGYFLDRLNAVQEGPHSLLDNCLMVYGSGIADGNRHDHHRLPILTVGSANGVFKTGLHVKYQKETPLTNLYVTIADRLGVPIRRIGDSTGRLRGMDA